MSGWIIPFSSEILEAEATLKKQGRAISIQGLAEEGIRPEALARAMIVDLPDGAPAPSHFTRGEGEWLVVSATLYRERTTADRLWWKVWARK